MASDSWRPPPGKKPRRRPVRRLIRRLPRRTLIVGAAWLLAIVAADAAVAGMPFRPPVFLLQAAATLVGILSVAFGYLLARQREIRDFVTAAALGTAFLILGSDAFYLTAMSAPRDNGGGGGCLGGCGCLFVLAVFGPVATVIAGFPLLAAALGTGALLGLLRTTRPQVRRLLAGVLAMAMAGLFWTGAGTWALSSALTSGNLITPTRANVTGTWVGPNGATLRVFRDGTFTARNLPHIDDSGFNDWVDSYDFPQQGKGTWTLSGSDSSFDNSAAVEFDFPKKNVSLIPGHPSYQQGYLNLEMDSQDGSLALFDYVGDADDDQTFQFLKQPG
ncbi:MAG: hypothetical protein FWE35_08415 [Streptosporangiales bacterium]|nr:hypothetical protein [Streptosporangiales bacterium]